MLLLSNFLADWPSAGSGNYPTHMINRSIFEQAIDPKGASALQFRLLNRDQTGLAADVEANLAMRSLDLGEKVSYGRSKQFELSKLVREARLKGESEQLLAELTEVRRLFHISTILARAELLTRPQEPSQSQYSGEEGKFDDLTILERARGFLELELEHESDASAHGLIMDRLATFTHAQRRVERTSY